MTFLKLNGITIPVAKGGSIEDIHIGDRKRSYSGQARRSTRRVKPGWKFKTIQLVQEKADLIRGLIWGFGDSWPFNNAYNSSKGKLVQGTPAASAFLSDTAADGNPVYNDNKQGTHSFSSRPATTNLLPAQDRDAENAPTGYAAFTGATLGSSTTYFWQGVRSVSVVTSGVGNFGGLRPSVISASASTEYCGSVYVFSLTACDLNLYFLDSTNAVTGPSTLFTTIPGEWIRVRCRIKTGVTGPASLSLILRNSNASQNYTYYCDGWQLEQNEYGTAWVDGTRGAGLADALYNDPAPFLQDDYATGEYSINFWAVDPIFGAADVTSGEVPVLFELYNSSTLNGHAFAFLAINASVGVISVGGDYPLGDTNVVANPTTEGYLPHMYTCVFKPYDGGTQKTLEVFKDGVSILSTTHNISNPIDDQYNRLAIGYEATGLPGLTDYNSWVDNFIIVPYALTQELITQLYSANSTEEFTVPYLTATGDFNIRDSQEVIGRVTKRDYKQVAISGTARNNAEMISFELEKK